MSDGPRIAMGLALVLLAFACGWLMRSELAPARPVAAAPPGGPVPAPSDERLAALHSELKHLQARATRAEQALAEQAAALARAKEQLAGRVAPQPAPAPAEPPASLREAEDRIAELLAALATRDRQLEFALGEILRLEQTLEAMR